MISVIIPVFNGANQLPKTLDLIFAQDYKDIEVIVVNDGSKDDIPAILTNYMDRIKYVVQENKGAPAARNLGFAKSSGEFVIFCDDDVRFLKSSAFRILLDALATHPDASYAYYSFFWGAKLFRGRPFDADFLKKQPYIHTSALIRREHFPGFDESFKKFQDWDLWLTMLEQGHVGYFVDDTLAKIETGGIYSSWLPSFMYKIPWKKFGIHIKTIEKYEEWMKVIKGKHGLV